MRRRSKVLLCALLALTAATVAAATAMPASAAAATVTYGTANVDGSSSEWAPLSGAIPMYEAGDPDKTHVSDAYLRYDCSSNTMYVLVQARPGLKLIDMGTAAWAFVGTAGSPPTPKRYTGASGDDGTPPDFRWLPANPAESISIDGASYNIVDGYEASFPLPEASYGSAIVHVEFAKLDVNGDWKGGTSANVGFGNSEVYTELALDCADVPAALDLTVSKTASPSFIRTYGWSISKGVDRTLVEQFGGTATFNYNVGVTSTGYADSEFTVSGTITVHNPNTFDVTGVDIADGDCTVTGGDDLTVPAGDDATATYTCSLASAADGTNTATATWSDIGSPSTSASGDAAYAFGDPTTEINKTVTVTDTFDGGTTTLGTVTYPGDSFSYSRTIAVPTWNCVTYANTAAITETGQSASQSVKVCGPARTGALTMGFWGTKNGQNIIKSYCGGISGTSLGAFLNAYNPFKDFTNVSGCTDDATYVTNVIKAATASGAAMNAMLKGQMLATALDVYFSDPALGGNRINAPAPIGGISVDLTNICTDLTCTAFENSSSVFGGSPKTVLEMLSYAASQSNVGGSIWYGNVKLTQELAKDAFDALNNEKVFAP